MASAGLGASLVIAFGTFRLPLAVAVAVPVGAFVVTMIASSILFGLASLRRISSSMLVLAALKPGEARAASLGVNVARLRFTTLVLVAAFLSAASVLSKVIVPGALFPVGIVTSFVGVPFFFRIMLRAK